jgi:hypothetical protein
MSSSHQEQITPAFSVGAGVGGRRGRAGGKCAGVKFCPRAAAAPGGELPGRTREKSSMPANAPALKKVPALGAQKDGKRHLTTRIYLYSLFSWNGEMRGGRWRVLSPWAHNAGTAYKGAGPTTQDIRGKNFLPGRHPGVR